MKEEVIDLTDLFKALGKYKWLIIISAIIGLGLGLILPKQTDTVTLYETSMQLLIGHSEIMVDGASSNSTDPNVQSRESTQKQLVLNALSAYQLNLMNDRVLKTYAEMLKNRATAELVANKAGDSVSTDEVAGKIFAEHVPDTQLIRVTVRSSSPEEAMLIASALGEVADEVFKKISSFRDKMDYGNTQAIVGVSVADPAVKPSGPVEGTKPNPLVNAALGLVAGLFVSLGIAFVLSFFSRLTGKTST